MLVGWLIAVVAATLGSGLVGGTYNDDFNLPGSPAQTGSALLQEHLPAAPANTGQVVLFAPDGVPAQQSSVGELAEQLATVPGVASISTPLAPGTVSNDGTTALLTLQLDRAPRTIDDATRDGLIAVQSGAPTGLQVDYGGDLGLAIDHQGHSLLPEIVGLAAALIVLLLFFGSVAAAVTPMLGAAVAVVLGLSLLGLLAASMTFATTAPTLATMIGLGCGIDYGLFLITRARQHLLDGVDPMTATRSALRASGHTVLVAAGTVAVALLGLYAAGIEFIGRLGLAATITLITAAAGAVTMVPAVLTLAGRRIDRWHVGRVRAEAGNDHNGWASYAGWVARHPVSVVLGAVSVLAVLAVPVFSLQVGHIDNGASPVSTTARNAYDEVEAAFGSGANGAFTVVLTLAADTTPDQLQNATQTLAETPGVAAVTPLQPSPDGAVAVATVTPTTGPQDAATTDLHDQLSGPVAATIAGSTGGTMWLTGVTAGQIDFAEKVTDRLPLIIGLVVLAAFLLLSITFRSPVVALKAAVMNVISIAASYGVLVAVFQWGWGSALFGVDEPVPVETFVPMLMFAIVFGLSMDYEVFLVSRIRETWLRGSSTTQSVADGLASTARVITAAGLIMISVFLAFTLQDDVPVKMLAVGLAASVLIDATIVRLLLVPATMVLLGQLAWWRPRWTKRAAHAAVMPAKAPATPQ